MQHDAISTSQQPLLPCLQQRFCLRAPADGLLQFNPVHAEYCAIICNLLEGSNAPRLFQLLEVALRTPQLQGTRIQELISQLPGPLPMLHAVASSPAGARALLSVTTSAVKRQQTACIVLAALIQARGELVQAAAGVVNAVPGAMGQTAAEEVLASPRIVVWRAHEEGKDLAQWAGQLIVRALALLDPVLSPLAAYLAATQLPPGQDSKAWAVEVLLSQSRTLACSTDQGMAWYRDLLVVCTPQRLGILQELSAGLALHQAAAAHKQAAKLVRGASDAAAEVEHLSQQLQGMWLESTGLPPAGLSSEDRELLAAGRYLEERLHEPEAASSSSSSSGSSSRGAAPASPRLPYILQRMCDMGLFQENEVLAAGDPAAWSSALGPTSEEDLRVASTALLAACKAAGAVAQLPGLLQQLKPLVRGQAWGQALFTAATAACFNLRHLQAYCDFTADLALLLAPLLAVLLPVEQASELQRLAATITRNTKYDAALTPATTARVLGLLGHVVAPGAPGCSYPGCCNMGGRSEAEMASLVCSKCGGARYCCREHQVAHWKAGHKEVCKATQAAAKQARHSAAKGGA
jgi:hypothetical protein